tara:strand:+ start:425 stop:685 length:261 start_codon:yes stop_codon:yes gene_type:complete
MVDNLNVELELKDVSEDEAALAELLEKGGEKQVPFLVDAEKNVSMYESSDIIEYLRENYANTAGSAAETSKPRVHVGGSVCESCEG